LTHKQTQTPIFTNKKITMKKLTLLLTILLATFSANAQNVAINNDGTAATGSAMLDVKSITKGFLMPRMTSAQRAAIASPIIGLLVFDTDTKTIWAYNGTAWTNLTSSGSGGFALPFDQTVNLSTPTFRIENNGTGDVFQVGSLGGATGLNVYTTNGFGMNVNTSNNIGILATSQTSNAIHAFTTNLANTIPTIRANNTGGGAGIQANSKNNNGILATTGAVGFSGVRGEASVNGANGVFGFSTSTNGVGVRGEASGTGTGVIGYSTNGTGMSAGSIAGTGLYANSISGLALNVNGNVKIAGGNTTPGAGKVLTSDANGNATWQTPTPPPAAVPKIAFRAAGMADPTGIDNMIPSSYPGELAIRKKVDFASLGYDFGGVYTLYNGSNENDASKFTVPMTGLYHFDAQFEFMFAVVYDFREIEISIMVQRGAETFEMARGGGYINSVDNTIAAVSADLTLLAGDKVYIAARQHNLGSLPSPFVSSVYSNFFNGHLVFPFGN
jgi:hypothetical protein